MATARTKGRPKLAGAREPSGRLSRGRAVNNIQRAFDAIKRAELDPCFGTPFGRLVLDEKITRHEFDAGLKFYAMRREMDVVLGAPSRTPRGMDLGGVRGTSLADDPDPKAIERFKRRFASVEAVLGDKKPGGMWWVVDQLVIHDISLVGYQQHLILKTALGALVNFFNTRA